MNGSLIVFEGIDGTGKTTQLKLLADYFRDIGREVIETREPTNGVWGQKIRKLYVDRANHSMDDEISLFVADRQEHVRKVIKPALEKNKIVLVDRYYYSTAAYQGAKGADTEKIFALNKFAPVPDIVFLFVLPVSKSIARIKQRGDVPNAFEQEKQLERVSALFLSFKDSNIIHIDANQTVYAIQRVIQYYAQQYMMSTQKQLKLRWADRQFRCDCCGRTTFIGDICYTDGKHNYFCDVCGKRDIRM